MREPLNASSRRSRRSTTRSTWCRTRSRRRSPPTTAWCWKPTELTPLTALALADILYEAGLPPEMLSVVTGWPADIGDEMMTNPDFDLITFTGGVRVGKLIADKAGKRRTRSNSAATIR